MKTKHGININKIYFCVILCSVFCLVITSQGYGQEQQLNDNAMRAMLALNYCHMALVNILAYEDRIILDEEYNNIINNISLSAIQDEEVVTILKQLMDLHSVTLIINYLFVSFRIRRSSVCLYLSYHPFIMSEDSNFISFIFHS